MKERPILFSGPMVRAILDGRKTVTRREVKKPAALDCLAAGFDPAFLSLPGSADLCPYGQPGDRLWVREAWARIRVAQAPGEEWVVYRACDNRTDYGGPWKPSIHMRRRDSRILLEVTDVRVERLQDISQADALAEGVMACERDLDPDGNDYSPCELFSMLWVSINGAESWSANPWVWAVEFKRLGGKQ